MTQAVLGFLQLAEGHSLAEDNQDFGEEWDHKGRRPAVRDRVHP